MASGVPGRKKDAAGIEVELVRAAPSTEAVEASDAGDQSNRQGARDSHNGHGPVTPLRFGKIVEPAHRRCGAPATGPPRLLRLHDCSPGI